MNRLPLLTAVIALTALPLPAQDQEQPSPWLADFDQAMAKAKKEGKDLLVDFTGSDWCGWCIKLDQEVFAHAEFLDAVTDDYVLVVLDYPRKEPALSKVPNPARNAEIAAEYAITGYPTIMLMTAEGDVLGIASYEAGGPKSYVAHLEKLAAEGRQHMEFVRGYERRYEKAKRKDREQIVTEVVAQLGQMSRDSYGVRAMARLAKQAFELDPANRRGLKHDAIRAIMTVGVADAETIEATKKADRKNKHGLYELIALDAVQKVRSVDQVARAVEVVEEVDALGFRDDDLALHLYTNAALWAAEHLSDAERAKKLAKKAIAGGAAGEERAQLQGILDG